MIDKIKEEICNYKLSTIRAFREHEDRFNILYTGLGSLVLYTRDGIIFAPNCSKISSINLNSYSDCSLDPQIEYIKSFTINSLDSELDKLTFRHDSSINTNIVIYSSDFDTKFLHNINEVITKIYRLIEKSGLLRIIIITVAAFMSLIFIYVIIKCNSRLYKCIIKRRLNNSLNKRSSAETKPADVLIQ
ncbi:hypothetical protein BpHYR1_042073 [Brachionus plicatilis]|uniref:Uncharacterized protein n=1 Tax=Brachionus plicatilis TaxID=10195 RepID=A0A3M7PBT1_BRAPC|nr:hypothetical protein BpHYR1_042073 [Brachionus plicatilis]